MNLLTRRDGTVTLFATVVILPVVIVALVVAEIGGGALETARLRSSLLRYVMSVAAGYDQNLLSDYGLYGITREQSGFWAGAEISPDITLTQSLADSQVLEDAIVSAGMGLWDYVAVERVVSKVITLGEYFGLVGAEEMLEDASKHAAEITAQAAGEIILQNLPHIDLEEIFDAICNMASALGDNWVAVGGEWLWNNGDKGLSLNFSGIVAEAKCWIREFVHADLVERVREGVGCTSYILFYMTAYNRTLDRHSVLRSAETEYCIFGYNVGSLNIMESYQRIFKMRLAINLVDYLINTDIPEIDTRIVCACILAVVATLSDVVSLMAGEAVSLAPHLDMVDTDYTDYLAVMLLTTNGTLLLARIGDIINMNLATNNQRSGLEDYFTCITATMDKEKFTYEYK
ncbi:MAG: hypothetical protein IKC38_02440 [Clostridia bacterium]|nr:hypothetical protein [Clostridia bacterium]